MHFTHLFFFICPKISRGRTIHQKSVASMPNLIDFLANWVQYTGIYPSLLPLCFAKIVTFACHVLVYGAFLVLAIREKSSLLHLNFYSELAILSFTF